MSTYEQLFRQLDEVGTLSRGKSKHRPRNDPVLYGGPHPFIQTGDVKHSNFYVTSFSQTYSDKGLAQSKLWPSGTLCITIAANIADTAILKFPACFPDSIIGFTAKDGVSSTAYVKYCLDTYKTQMRSISQGTTQDNMSQGKLLSLKFRIPDYTTQQKIAAILSAYDDLIANNQRRITLLERMAEDIYREWFVRLRFPGHEQAKIEKGVPQGWTVHKFRDIVQNYIGGGWGEEIQSATHSEAAYVIRGTDIPGLNTGDTKIRPYRFHTPSNLKSRLLKSGDLVFEVSGGSKDQLLGRNLLISEKLLQAHDNHVICASFCKLLRFDTTLASPYAMKYFFKLYYETELVGLYQVQSTGISNYQFEAFLNYQTVLLPPMEIQDKFDALVKPILELKDDIALQTVVLRQTRDALIPRLISGKLAVDALDIRFPPGMTSTA
jgi:type I restriction enzyme S subunit